MQIRFARRARAAAIVVVGAVAATLLPAVVAMPGSPLGPTMAFASPASAPRAAAWGDNLSGTLGNGYDVNDASGRYETAFPVSVSGLVDVSKITVGGAYGWGDTAFAETSDGTVWGWGDNDYGQLGVGLESWDREWANVPVKIPALTGARSIAVGVLGTFAVAANADGTVSTWGSNDYGTLGNGNDSSTQPYSTAPVTVSGLTDVVAVSAGQMHDLALKSDGTVWAWGDNSSGELGDNQAEYEADSPVQVSGLTDVTAVAATEYDSLALKSDGTVWAWGCNCNYEVGDGTNVQRNTPVQVTGLSDVTAISGGNESAAALKSDGTVWTWGDNYYGALGQGDFDTRETPTQIDDLDGVTAIAVGDEHMLALKDDGTVWAWGDNSDFQLGIGGYAGAVTPQQVIGIADVSVIAAGAYNSVAIGTVIPHGGALTPGEQRGGGTNSDEVCPCRWAGLTNQTRYPVTTSTGNFWHTFTDLTVPGRGAGLAFTRTYNAYPGETVPDGPLGYGWTDSYATALTIAPDLSTVTVNQASGATVTFTASGGSYSAPPRVTSALAHNTDGTWTLTRNDRETLVFNSTGQLTTDTDLNGNTTTLGYDGSGRLTSVTDPSSRQLTIAYNTAGKIESVTDPASRQVTFDYDSNGDLTTATDALGAVTTFTYEADHRLLTMLDPNQQSLPTAQQHPLTNVYDGQGRVTSQTDPLQQTTTFDYTSEPGWVFTTDPAGHVTADQYSFGVLITKTIGYGTAQAATTYYSSDPTTLGVSAIVDPNGNTTYKTYDANGNVTTTSDPLGRTTSYTYDSHNNVLTVTDPSGERTTNTYDTHGNLTSTSAKVCATAPCASTAPNRTNSAAHTDTSHPGDVTSVTDPNGKTTTFTYDTYGDVATATDPLGNVTRNCYDTIGQLVGTISPVAAAASTTCSSMPSEPAPPTAAVTPPANTTAYAVDTFGRVVRTVDGLGHDSRAHYDLNGNLDSSTDANGNTTTFVVDAIGQRREEHRPDSTVLKTDYWPDGALKSQTDAANAVTSYAYDAARRLTSVTDPLSRVTHYGYDAAGNQTSKQDPGGNCAATPATACTTYSYDNANQLTGITYSDGVTPNVTGITYNHNGQRSAMTDGTGASSWAYDSLGRMTGSTLGTTGPAVGYGYDLASRVTSIVYPGSVGTVSRGYDDAGRLTSVTDWNSNQTVFNYDANSFLTSQVYPNGTTATYVPDGADRIASISDAPTSTPGSPFASFAYSRDNMGQLTAVTSTGVPSDTHTYGYNTLNQLSTVDTTTHTYDTADNLTGLPSGTTQAFDAGNQLCWTAPTGTGTCASPPTGATTYSYDTRGNQTQVTPPVGSAVTLGYDQANRLTSYGTTASYTYNGDGLRMSKTVASTTTSFVWDVAEGLPQLLADGTTNYIYGPDGTPLEQITSTGNTSYYHHDQLGSTRALTDNTGAVTATYTYDAYGKVAGSTGSVTNPFGYAGQYTDPETGLQYLRARYYDPATAQFLSRDPLVASTRDAYGYAARSPLAYTDPSGMCFASFCDDWGDDINNAWDNTGGNVVSWVDDNRPTCFAWQTGCQTYAQQHPALQSGLVVVADLATVVACTAATFGTCGAALLLAAEAGMLRDASRGGGVAALRNDSLVASFSYVVSAAACASEMPFVGSLAFGTKTAAGGSSGDIQVFLRDLGVIG